MSEKSSKVTPLIPIGVILSEYNSLREQKKKIEDRMSKLSSQIKEHAEKVGVKDDKGSFYAEDENFVYGKQCKKSVSFNKDKAIAYFKEKGYTSCIDTVEVINENEVESLINSGDISYEELEDITTVKVTYAIDVKQKEEMPEVQQTKANIAASTKTRLVIPRGGRK